MSGPIVRTGATPEFWANWDNVFGKKKKTAAGAETAGKKSTKSTAKKKAAKKVAKKK